MKEKERKKTYNWIGIKIRWTGMELDWTFFGRKNWSQMLWKSKGNGMEMEWNFFVQTIGKNFDVMEWKWNGVEKENFK